MVTISTPSPMPETSRQRLRPKASCLQRDHDVGRRIPEKRPGEDRPASEPVGEEAAEDRADEEAGEQRGDEARDAGRAEQARGVGRQHAGLDQARRDVSGEQEVVELEEHAEAEQHDDRSRSCASPAAGRCGPKWRRRSGALLRCRSCFLACVSPRFRDVTPVLARARALLSNAPAYSRTCRSAAAAANGAAAMAKRSI